MLVPPFEVCYTRSKKARDRNLIMIDKKTMISSNTKVWTWLKQNWPIILILLLASFARLFQLGKLPNGVLIDEAYGAYNAWALMTEGIDDRGYAFPVYFVAWGSGMNALYLYMGYFLFQLFGATITIYRIPQAIFGILSVLSMYVLGKELFSKKFGWLLAFLLAINPWHINISRFGLESNIAPAMFLIGLTLCIYGIQKKESFLLLGTFFFGLSLYAYAQTWIILPIFLVLFLLFYYKRLPSKKIIIGAIVLLFCMALPLLLFLAINYNLIPEIKTAYFSIPKLLEMRASEIHVENILNSIHEINKIIIQQYDGFDYSARELTGAFYYFTTPFMLWGIFSHIIKLVKNWKFRKTELEFVMILWLISAYIAAIMNENITTTHINMLYLPLIFYIGYGIWDIINITKSKLILPLVLLCFSISFVVFANDYLHSDTKYLYSPKKFFFDTKGEEALAYAESLVENNEEIVIYMNDTYKYPLFLWYQKISPSYYKENVIYCGEAGWQEIETFRQYRYINSEEEISDQYKVFILLNSQTELFLLKGYDVIEVNEWYSVAVR